METNRRLDGNLNNHLWYVISARASMIWVSEKDKKKNASEICATLTNDMGQSILERTK